VGATLTRPVPQQLLHRADIIAVLEQVRREAVTKRVAACRFARNPIAVATFGPQAVILQAHDITHLIEQFFGLVRRDRIGHDRGHDSLSNGRQLRGQVDYTE
jgi:predicted protein tyrosine phosphatase